MIEIYCTERAYRILRTSVNTRMIDLYMAGVNGKFFSYMTRLSVCRMRGVLIYSLMYEDFRDQHILHYLGSYDPVTLSGRNSNEMISMYAWRQKYGTV